MADNRYSIEYAKTGRSSCKNSSCKGNIEKGSLRIGKFGKNPFSDDPEDTKTDWFHYNCIFDALTRARAATKKIDSVDDLEGFEDMKDSDKQLVRDLVKSYVDDGYKKKAAPKKRKSKKDDDNDDDEKKPRKKKAAPKKKKDEDEDAGDDEDEKPAKKPAKKPAMKAHKGDDDDDDNDGGGKTYLESDSKTGGKFWEISVSGSEVTVRHGKIGAGGQTSTKDLGSAAKAEKFAQKQIEAKKKKGYSPA
jgi:predicted DNA-binding WGR domain protein